MKMIRSSRFWRPKRFRKKFNQYWKKKFSINKKVGHSQKEQDQFFYVKGSKLSTIVKVQKYSLEETFSKRLLFFIPFYIFSHEKYFPEYESNELKLQKLCEEYSYIQTKLDDLQKTGEVSEFNKSAVCVMTNHVLALIAQKYNRVQEGVENVMRGKIIDYEAKTIRNEEPRNLLPKRKNEQKICFATT